MNVIKSIQNSDRDILQSIKTLYLDGNNFDLDPCYSTGKLYEDLERPRIKMDKEPKSDDIEQNDILAGFLYLTPVKERTKSDIFADYNVLLEIETKNIRLTAFEGCEKWEVLCWGNILSENIKQLKVN